MKNTTILIVTLFSFLFSFCANAQMEIREENSGILCGSANSYGKSLYVVGGKSGHWNTKEKTQSIEVKVKTFTLDSIYWYVEDGSTDTAFYKVRVYPDFDWTKFQIVSSRKGDSLIFSTTLQDTLKPLNDRPDLSYEWSKDGSLLFGVNQKTITVNYEPGVYSVRLEYPCCPYFAEIVISTITSTEDAVKQNFRPEEGSVFYNLQGQKITGSHESLPTGIYFTPLNGKNYKFPKL